MFFSSQSKKAKRGVVIKKPSSDVKKIDFDSGDSYTFEAKSVKYDGPFSCPWEDSDVTLIVEDQQLYVHSAVLSVFSPVFKAMLTNGMKESETKEIKLEGKTMKNVLLFLKLLYPQHQSSLDTLNVEDLDVLMKFSDEYMVESIKPVIELVAINLAMKHCFLRYSHKLLLDVLYFAEQNKFKKALEMCIESLAKKSKGNVPLHKLFTHFAGNSSGHGLSLDQFDKFSDSTKLKLCTAILKEANIQNPTCTIEELIHIVNYIS